MVSRQKPVDIRPIGCRLTNNPPLNHPHLRTHLPQGNESSINPWTIGYINPWTIEYIAQVRVPHWVTGATIFSSDFLGCAFAPRNPHGSRIVMDCNIDFFGYSLQ